MPQIDMRKFPAWIDLKYYLLWIFWHIPPLNKRWTTICCQLYLIFSQKSWKSIIGKWRKPWLIYMTIDPYWSFPKNFQDAWNNKLKGQRSKAHVIESSVDGSSLFFKLFQKFRISNKLNKRTIWKTYMKWIPKKTLNF